MTTGLTARVTLCEKDEQTIAALFALHFTREEAMTLVADQRAARQSRRPATFHVANTVRRDQRVVVTVATGNLQSRTDAIVTGHVAPMRIHTASPVASDRRYIPRLVSTVDNMSALAGSIVTPRVR